MPADIRAVVFDLDGTLADTLADIAAAMSHVLVQLQLQPYTVDEYRAWVGWGVRHLVEQALPAGSEHLADDATARFRGHYASNLVIESTPYPGVPELLDSLTNRFTIAVLSNKPHAMTKIVVDTLLGRWDFADVVGKREGVPRKPDPTSALALAERLGVAPAQCVYVGDTMVDMKTATAAGMVPVGVGWGFRDRAQLLASGALQVIDHPSELLGIIEDLQKSVV